MDISTIIGVGGCFAMVVMGIFTSGGTILTYVDIPSVLIVVVGSYLGLFTFSNISTSIGIFQTIGLTFKIPNYNENGIISKLMAMSEKARREGLLALEEELEDLDDEFMKKGLRLVVDGTDAEIIRGLLETELNQIQDRHAGKIGVVNMWGTLAPGLGMLGTVIGLIAMLKNLEDKSALGPNMAVALITTLYGSMMANLLMIPWSGKLKTHDANEAKVKEMIIEGILSIQAGDNPRILATKLLSYLNPTDRKSAEAEFLKD
ncbi:motility protein A [Leadbettera azotonutricia]|uniref:Chemotaxis protein PomA n=1 Tax=Leadbettera azotonutricia (strain ATCC BAA-888 / DSM 13862 / ZAS-9) TaxID=545695 RepID=F5YEV9_LEAAZ|nr:motility protein A [Leadbettera azotonutricia]AEF80753.1 chemotaxis protein PomA [Leadbettera azotonutricia ZAS-9]